MIHTKAGKFHREVEAFKRELLARTLVEHGGNRTHAAATLGLQRTYLVRLIRQHGLHRTPGGRRGPGAP